MWIDRSKQMTTQTNTSSVEILKELPPEILHRILNQFCDGKSLSTLSVVCACAANCPFYERLAYEGLLNVSKAMLCQVDSEIMMTKMETAHLKENICMFWDVCLEELSDWIRSVATIRSRTNISISRGHKPENVGHEAHTEDPCTINMNIQTKH